MKRGVKDFWFGKQVDAVRCIEMGLPEVVDSEWKLCPALDVLLLKSLRYPKWNCLVRSCICEPEIQERDLSRRSTGGVAERTQSMGTENRAGTVLGPGTKVRRHDLGAQETDGLVREEDY